jgi:hypothetical protein
VTFQFTASAVNWRGRLNEYQAHAAGLPNRYAVCQPLMRGVMRLDSVAQHATLIK